MATTDEKWPVELLTGLRQQGDPLAGELVHNLFVQGQAEAVSQLLTTLVRNDDIPPTGLPPAVYQYLQEATLPPVDPERVLGGQELFRRHGNLALVVLLCASLPECYLMKKGVEVLWLTQQLEAHVLRRLLETAQMVVSVLMPGGLGPNGRGIRRAQKVRLMHAAIRHLILCGSAPQSVGSTPSDLSEVLLKVNWDTATLGIPINQEDMLYTLLTFSFVIPRGLERLGVHLMPEHKEAFIYCWNVVGTIMGLQPELLPQSYAEAGVLFERIKQLEAGPSQPAQAMTAALIRCIQQALPDHLMSFAPAFLMRQMLDPTSAQWLGVPEPGILARLAGDLLLKEVHGTADLIDFAREENLVPDAVWNWFSQRLMHYLLNLQQPPGWKRSLFTLPEGLANEWQIPLPPA
jgi:hypothetical protein